MNRNIATYNESRDKGENKIKIIIIRRFAMNQIQEIKRIKTFLEDYKSLEPYLQNICKDSVPNYNKKLMRLYVDVSKHPYPNECL
jgi:hypothetical protein